MIAIKFDATLKSGILQNESTHLEKFSNSGTF
jgi:hypothetical protein